MLINNSKKIVIKLGSSTVVDKKGKLKKDMTRFKKNCLWIFLVEDLEWDYYECKKNKKIYFQVFPHSEEQKKYSVLW